MANRYDALTKKALELGAVEAKLTDTEQIGFDPRSYLKCQFGCELRGRFWTCPPNLDLFPEMITEALERSPKALLIKTADPRLGREMALLLEKEAVQSHGCSHALALVLCVQCEECAHPDPCRCSPASRSPLDAVGVDMVKKLRSLGLHVDLDKEGKLLPAWYGMVLLG